MSYRRGLIIRGSLLVLAAVPGPGPVGFHSWRDRGPVALRMARASQEKPTAVNLLSRNAGQELFRKSRWQSLTGWYNMF